MRILLVDSDLDVFEKLKTDYIVDVACDSEEGIYLSQVNDYAAIIVESSLPDFSKLDFCKQARSFDNNIPILVLMGNSDIDKRIDTLKCGADAVLSKPVSIEELQEYLRILIARANNIGNTSTISVDDLSLDLAYVHVARNGMPISLRRKEYEILKYLMINSGKIISKEKILENVWDMGYEVQSNTLEVHMKSLRDKIDRDYDKKLIKTVYGFGYKICG